MQLVRLLTTLGLAGISLASLTGDAGAQDERAPRIRVSRAMGSVASSYVEPSIGLSEDAYVLAISVDVDRNIRILHPEYPGIAVKMNSSRDLYLPRFFTGYGGRERGMNARSGGYVSSYYDGFDAGYSDTRGTVIALASRRPFNFDAITTNGDWNLAAVSRLIAGRDPRSAASALADRLGARGEEIGSGVYRFAGESRTYATLYNTTSYRCNPYYGALGYSRGISLFRAAQLRRAGYQVTFIGIDACGEPRYAVHSRGLAENPGRRPPAVGAFPRPRTPAQRPRNPATGRTRTDDSTSASGRPTRGYTEPERVTQKFFPSPDRTAERNRAANARAAERNRVGNPRTTERNPVTSTRNAERNPAANTQRRPAASGAFPTRARATPSLQRAPVERVRQVETRPRHDKPVD